MEPSARTPACPNTRSYICSDNHLSPRSGTINASKSSDSATGTPPDRRETQVATTIRLPRPSLSGSPEIVCPKCKTNFLLTDALRLEIEEGVIERERGHHRVELEQLRVATEEHAREVAEQQFALDLRNSREDAAEQRDANKELRQTLVELNKQLRGINAERDAEKLKLETTIRESEDAIRVEERERATEAHRLKDLEKDKKLTDAVAAADRMRIQLEQGSQQGQGEVLELDLETQLRQLFPNDDIIEVKKGVRGADVRQIVRTSLGTPCGSILWETKNAQWQSSWIGKLKTDMRDAGADQAVLISVHTPDSIGAMTHLEGTVWAARPKATAALATVLRQALLQMHANNALSVSKDERIEALHKYVTGPEFRHRMEAMAEAFTSMQEELEKERRWCAQKWARQEQSIRAMVDNVAGLYGDFEGLGDRALLSLTAPAKGTGVSSRSSR